MEQKIKRDIVLICPGGCMAGVFGGGVVTAFQEANLYPQIKTIYAGSAGAFNAAFFLARQTRLGSTIYCNDLAEEKFIKPKKLPKAYWQRFVNRYIKRIPKGAMNNVTDLDYLIHIIKNKKKLDIERILKSKIEFKIAVTELKNLKLKIFNGKTKSILKILKASADIIPYYSHSIELYGKRYIDGMIIDPIFISGIIKKLNPEDKIIVINNISIDKKFLLSIRSFLEAVAVYLMYRKKDIYKIFVERNKKFKQGLKLIKKYKNIYLINPPNDKTTASTTDRKNLLETYNYGIKKGKKFLKKHKWIKV